MSEVRPLFGSYLLSTVGDELARLALTVLVYQRTASPLFSAITFGISYLPWLLGGPVLATLADRFPRRTVLVVSDVVRAVLVALMAVPGLPLWTLLGLLLLVSVCNPPFEAARSALVADVLTDDRYAVATSVTGIVLQLSSVLGFLFGGALLLVVAPVTALAANAGTFVVSAVWLWFGLQRRPAPQQETGTTFADVAAGLRLVLGTPRLLAIVTMVWVGGLFLTAPEGIAAPWAGELAGGTVLVGLLLAANPVGSVVGGVVVGRFCPPSLRERLLLPLVVLSMTATAVAGLMAVLVDVGPARNALVLGFLVLAGVGSAWSIPLNVAFVQAVPSAFRGRAFGVAVSGLSGASGLGIVLAGVAAEVVPPSVVVAVGGVVGVLAMIVPMAALLRTRPPTGTGAAGPSQA